MSDTPRTDAAVQYCNGNCMGTDWVAPEIARTLERELAEARRDSADFQASVNILTDNLEEARAERDDALKRLSEAAQELVRERREHHQWTVDHQRDTDAAWRKVNAGEAYAERLRAALQHAVSEADGWCDEARGYPCPSKGMIEARALAKHDDQPTPPPTKEAETPAAAAPGTPTGGGTIPEGYALVPLVPTEAMTDAAETLIPWSRGTESRRGIAPPEQVYAAMLAAAPKVPSPGSSS